MKGNRLFICTILFFVYSAMQLPAEMFRVKKTVIFDLTSSEEQPSQKAGINDAIAVLLPQDLTFIQGIELSIKIPSDIAACKNTIVYSLYTNVSPVPSAKNIDYSGEELYTGLYPGQYSWTISIPLVQGNTIKKNPYGDKTLIPDISRGFVFLRNQLAMKGIPQSVYDSTFEVSVRPILKEIGALKIVSVDQAPLKDISVIIDEKNAVTDRNGLILLKPGAHNVSVISDDYRNELRTVMIEKAGITVLNLDLKSIAPVVKIRTPEGTQVYVDGKKIDSAVLSNLESGEHIFRFEIGGYEVTKNIAIENGNTYDISIVIDANITKGE